MDAHTIVSSGVDWLTATAYRTRSNERFHDLGVALLDDEAKQGNDISTWKAQGYRGTKAAGVRVGLRHDTHIIQLSSDAAHEHWKEVAELATNITRVDLEVTFELEQVEHGFIRRNFELMRQHHAGRGRARNLSVIENTVKGCTLYAGARSSDIYARGYDKGAESKTMEKGKLFRQELEMKRQLAKDIVVELQTADSVPLYCASVVSSHFRKLGAETSNVIESNRKSARACQPSNDCQRLRWLGSAVAPSVRLLLSKGKHVEVARALGLDEAALLLLLQAVKAQTKGDEDNGSTEAI